MWHWYGMGLFGWLGMLLYWGLVLVGIFFLLRYLDRLPPNRASDRQSEAVNSALEILRERYARGEIDLEEFEQRRRGLG